MKKNMVTYFEYIGGGWTRAHYAEWQSQPTLFDETAGGYHTDFMYYTKKEIIAKIRSQGITVGRDAVRTLYRMNDDFWYRKGEVPEGVRQAVENYKEETK